MFPLAKELKQDINTFFHLVKLKPVLLLV